MSEVEELVKEWNELGEEYKSLEVKKRNILECFNDSEFSLTYRS